MIPVTNVNRSRHQDRTWKKSYRFLQMPNWQWIDSIRVTVDTAEEYKTLISGQLFSSRTGDTREGYFKEKLRPFCSQVSRTLKLLGRETIETVLPEQGEKLDFQTGMNEYKRYLSAASSSSAEHRPEKREKLIVLPYVSTFGYTEQLAEAIASGASQVADIRTELIEAYEKGTQFEIITI